MARNGRNALRGLKEVPVETPESVDPPTLTQRLVQFRDKYKLGPHHKMERFGLLFGVSVTGIVLVAGIAFFINRADMANIASETAIMSEEFTYSLSGQSGDVLGVYGDSKRTDVTVLFQMDDPKSMSADAKNYQLFITGAKDSIDPATAPDVSFGLFGSTGYGFIRFEDKKGLPNEVLDVTIRSSANLSISESSSTELTGDSFSEFDQAQLFVNPGATRVSKVDYPVGEEDPTKLYTTLVGKGLDEEIRKEIEASTKLMGTSLNRATEYRNRLESSGYVPPKTPWFVEGDYIDKDGYAHFDSYLSLAHKVDYKDYTLADGYIRQVAGDLKGFDKYVEAYNDKQAHDYNRDDKKPEDVKEPERLKRKDGSSLTLANVITGTSSSAQVAAKDATTDLIESWRTYVMEKGKIQRQYTYKMLVLDADVLSQRETYSKNDTKDVAVFY